MGMTEKDMRPEAGSDDVREAAYRLCGALGKPPIWLPSEAELRGLLQEAYERRVELQKRIEQAERVLGMSANQ